MSSWRFLKCVFAWLAAALCVSGITAGALIKHQHNHAVQLRWQAGLLAELSGYESQELNQAREDPLLRETVTVIRNHSVGEVDFEASLVQTMDLLSMARRVHTIRLVENYEGHIVSSLGGDIGPARQIEAEWMAQRHPNYRSHGLFPTLLFVYIFGYIGLWYISYQANKGFLRIKELELHNKSLEETIEKLQEG